MPTPHVSGDQMKKGGKNWTKAELESRERAEAGMRRGKVRLRRPAWLTDEAIKVWNRTRRLAVEIGIIDNLDAEMLAVYCDVVVKYGKLSDKISQAEGIDSDSVKLLQSYARLIAQYADKLGFTPAARARLAKKKADEIVDGFGDEFD